MKTLLLTEKELKTLLTMEESIREVEDAFKMRGLLRTQMPPKQYLFLKKYNGDLRTMPAYLEETDIVVVKVVNSHPQNPSRHGLPAVIATILMIDPQTGAPKAIMGGNWITALRTGAAGAIAAKYLANPNPKVVGIIGAGTQAHAQLAGLLQAFKTIEEVKVWDIDLEAARRFDEEQRNQFEGLNSHMFENVEAVVKGSDIVVTATPSRRPIVMRPMVSEGTHLNCMGADAPGKQELDPTILTEAKIVVDDWEQACHSGEINIPLAQGIIRKENVWGDICQIAAQRKPGRTTSTEITVFTSTGLAVQDAALAGVAYSKALEKNIGKFVDIMT